MAMWCSALAAAGARAPERYESRIVIGSGRTVAGHACGTATPATTTATSTGPVPAAGSELDPAGWRVEITV